MTGEMIVEIANQFLILNDINNPHMRCRTVTNGLSFYFETLGIPHEKVIYDVDVKHFNGPNEYLSLAQECDVIEHHCLKVGWNILDATASQFNDPQGNTMPRIYFGPLPTWYENES